MGINQVKFKLNSSFSYLAIGGIRFYDDQTNLIDSGNLISSTSTKTETDNFIITSNSVSNGDTNYHLFFAFDISKPLIGSYTEKVYWLTTTTSNVEIVVEFKNPIPSLQRLVFTPIPDPSNNNRGINSPFILEVKYEDGTVRSNPVNSSAAKNTSVSYFINETGKWNGASTGDSIVGKLISGKLEGRLIVNKLGYQPPMKIGGNHTTENLFNGFIENTLVGNLLKPFKGTPLVYIWKGIEYNVGSNREVLNYRNEPTQWHPLHVNRDNSQADPVKPYDNLKPNWG